MVYRAKVTKILSWVESIYNVNEQTFVRDRENVWIEVENSEEAYQLECINELQAETNMMKSQFLEKFL